MFNFNLQAKQKITIQFVHLNLSNSIRIDNWFVHSDFFNMIFCLATFDITIHTWIHIRYNDQYKLIKWHCDTFIYWRIWYLWLMLFFYLCRNNRLNIDIYIDRDSIKYVFPLIWCMHIASILSFHAVKSPHESLHSEVSTRKSPFESLHTEVFAQKSPLSKNRRIRIRAYSHFSLLLLWVPVGGGNGQQSIALFQIARSHMTRFDFFGVVARKPSLCSVSNAFTLIPAYFKNANI